MIGGTGVYLEDGQEYAALVTRTTPQGDVDLAVCVPPATPLYDRGQDEPVQWVHRRLVPYDYAYRPEMAGREAVPALEGHWRPRS